MTQQERRTLDALIFSVGWLAVVERLHEAATTEFGERSEVAHDLERVIQSLDAKREALAGYRR